MGSVLAIINQQTVEQTINEKRIIDPAKPPDCARLVFLFCWLKPSIPYMVPQSRETPVSPASPGSIFGLGPS
jgi:hypothetical protein